MHKKKNTKMTHESFINSTTFSSSISTAPTHPTTKKRTRTRRQDNFDIGMATTRRLIKSCCSVYLSCVLFKLKGMRICFHCILFIAVKPKRQFEYCSKEREEKFTIIMVGLIWIRTRAMSLKRLVIFFF